MTRQFFELGSPADASLDISGSAANRLTGMRTQRLTWRRGTGALLLSATLVACVSSQPDLRLTDSEDWERVDARGLFSFLAPTCPVRQDVMGIDSYIGEYRGEDVVLFFNYGQHSNSLRNEGQAGYSARAVAVDGRDARLVRYQVRPEVAEYRHLRYFSGLHVPGVLPARLVEGFRLGATSLTMSILCRRDADCDALEAALLSVEFR